MAPAGWDKADAKLQWSLLLLKLLVYAAFVVVLGRNWLVLRRRGDGGGGGSGGSGDDKWWWTKYIHAVFLLQVALYVASYVYFVRHMQGEHALTFKLHELLNDMIKIMLCANAVALLEDFNAGYRNVLAGFMLALVCVTAFDIATDNRFKSIYFFEAVFYSYSFYLSHSLRALTLMKVNWSKAEIVNLVKFNLIYSLELILVLVIVAISVDAALFDLGLTTAKLYEAKFLKYLVILLQYFIYTVPLEQTIANIEYL